MAGIILPALAVASAERERPAFARLKKYASLLLNDMPAVSSVPYEPYLSVSGRFP